MLRDLRFGLRMLLKHPGFTAIVVVILAVGIGANTAIFSFLDRVFLRPLPVNKPHELVLLKHRDQTGYEGDGFIYPVYVSFREQSQAMFSGLIACWLGLADLSVGNTDSQVPAMAVSSDYYSVLGVTPVLGRAFLPEEDRLPGAHPVAIISHRLWQQRFGRDPSVLGIYGVLAWSVLRRTREIGVRMALGAQRADVLRLVVRQGMGPAAGGIVTGLVVALAVTRLLRSVLFGLSPLDPITFAGSTLLFGLVALLACYLPARRALKIDPVMALRSE